jgi:hypothetical protein
MPPKRKNAEKKGESPKKKTRSEDTPESDGTTVEVNWAIPKGKGKQIYQERYATKHAQGLYGRARNEIRSQQTPLSVPQFRTPVFQTERGNDLQAEDKSKPSASLRNLFNEIKSKSAQKEDRNDLAHFEQQFGENSNTAVVLSRAENDATFVLNEDQSLEV